MSKFRGWVEVAVKTTGGRGAFNFIAFEKIMIEDLIPYIEADFRTLADQSHRAMAGLSMGGMQTRSIAPAHLETFSHIGVFSGGSIAGTNITDMAKFKEKGKVVFVSYGSKELGPHLNATRTTFVADNGERLRGPFTSTGHSSPLAGAASDPLLNSRR
jgi:predicted alpha/beta superfamily hydrolase